MPRSILYPSLDQISGIALRQISVEDDLTAEMLGLPQPKASTRYGAKE